MKKCKQPKVTYEISYSKVKGRGPRHWTRPVTSKGALLRMLLWCFDQGHVVTGVERVER